MTQLFHTDFDYILFVFGLGFVLLAITLYGLARRFTSPFTWRWLATSSVLLGLGAWLDMLTLAAGEGRGPPGDARDPVHGGVLVPPLQFARLTWSALGGRRIGRWSPCCCWLWPLWERLPGRPVWTRWRAWSSSPGWSVGGRRVRALPPQRGEARARPAGGGVRHGPLRGHRVHHGARGEHPTGLLLQSGSVPGSGGLPRSASRHGVRHTPSWPACGRTAGPCSVRSTPAL